MTNSVRVDKLGACLVSMLQVCQLKMIYGLDIGVEGVIVQGALEEVWPYDPPASGPGQQPPSWEVHLLGRRRGQSACTRVSPLVSVSPECPPHQFRWGRPQTCFIIIKANNKFWLLMLIILRRSELHSFTDRDLVDGSNWVIISWCCHLSGLHPRASDGVESPNFVTNSTSITTWRINCK